MGAENVCRLLITRFDGFQCLLIANTVALEYATSVLQNFVGYRPKAACVFQCLEPGRNLLPSLFTAISIIKAIGRRKICNQLVRLCYKEEVPLMWNVPFTRNHISLSKLLDTKIFIATLSVSLKPSSYAVTPQHSSHLLLLRHRLVSFCIDLFSKNGPECRSFIRKVTLKISALL